MTIQITINVPRDTNETARVTMKPVGGATAHADTVTVSGGQSWTFPADENVSLTIEMQALDRKPDSE